MNGSISTLRKAVAETKYLVINVHDVTTVSAVLRSHFTFVCGTIAWQCFRYLAHGGSQVICAASYRIGRTTASEIIQETCQALRKVLEPLYRPASIPFLLFKV